MNQKIQSFDDQIDPSKRFLMRNSSASTLNLFGCCSPSSMSGLQSSQPQKTQPHKISIKNVLKRSAIYGCNDNSQISLSHYNKGGKNKEFNSKSNKFLNRRISEFSQLSAQTLNYQSETKIPIKRPQNINFVYNKDSKDNSIHNYHTTNYLVEKYIVQAEQTNVLLKNQKDKKINSPQKSGFNANGYHQNAKMNQNNGYRQQEDQFLSQKAYVYKDETPQNNCHFSFGQHQKTMFMNKFGGFREVCSNRPSKQSAQVQSDSQVLSIAFDNQQKPLNFFKNKNQKLHHLVRNVQTMNEQISDSSSDKSQVIDSYQNIMSRIQEKSINSKLI